MFHLGGKLDWYVLSIDCRAVLRENCTGSENRTTPPPPQFPYSYNLK